MKIKQTYKYIVILLVCIYHTSNLYAQRESQYTHYMYNTSIINPGYSGSRGGLSVFGSYRNQWGSIDGAPISNGVSFHTPLKANSKLSMGASFAQDRIGPSSLKTFSTDISYALKFGAELKHHLSFGIKTSADLLNIDYNRLNIKDTDDPYFQLNIDNSVSPNFGTGVFAYGQSYYVGFSVPRFFERKFYGSDSSSLVIDKVNYYILGGYIYEANDYLTLKPAILTKIVGGSPLQIDLSINALLYDSFTIGASYRWKAAVSALAGFQITDRIFFGYSYDTDTSNFGNYNSGSHEVFLRFEVTIKGNNGRAISPRFF